MNNRKKSGYDELKGSLLWQVSCNWRRQIEVRLKEFNLTHTQFVILTYISSYEKRGLTQAEIAEKSGIDVATASQVIRYLEKKDFIVRERLEGDERAKYPKVTKKGSDVLNKAKRVIMKIDSDFFSPLLTGVNDFIDNLVRLV